MVVILVVKDAYVVLKVMWCNAKRDGYRVVFGGVMQCSGVLGSLVVRGSEGSNV